MLHAVHCAVAAAFNNANFAALQHQERVLRSVIDGGGLVEKDTASNMVALEKQLIASGARRSYSPLN